MITFKSTMGVAALAALTAMAGPGYADEPATAPAAAPAAASSTLSDMRVVRDKETGQLRAPTREESAEIDAMPRKSSTNVVVVSRPVSTVEARSDGSLVGKRSLDDMENLVMEKTADGKTVLRHGDEVTPTTPAAQAELPTE